MLQRYRGLRKEIYVLFYGRVVTSMGAMIWPMMTLILTNKMNMGASDAALLLLIFGLGQLPFTLFGGVLADRFNKKNNIIICDLITVISYAICAFIPLSTISLFFMFTASAFAAFEHPSYQALLADLSASDEREQVYSLSYLGMNLGFVIAPALGGLLFEHYLPVAFLLTSLATLSSTLLIAFLVKDIKRRESKQVNIYEQGSGNLSVCKVLKQNPCVALFIFIIGASTLVYTQLNFLLPLNMERSFGVDGARYYGLLSSVNALVVIAATPIFTTLLTRIQDTKKLRLGLAIQVLGFTMFMFIQGILWLHYVAIIIFTFGEVIVTLGMAPYVSRRIPALYRGRMSAVEMVFRNLFEVFSRQGIACLVELISIVQVWGFIGIYGFILVLLVTVLIHMDRRYYPLLQQS